MKVRLTVVPALETLREGPILGLNFAHYAILKHIVVHLKPLHWLVPLDQIYWHGQGHQHVLAHGLVAQKALSLLKTNIYNCEALKAMLRFGRIFSFG